MTQNWAVTLGLFGIKLTFHIPGGHFIAFAIGVVFWGLVGPWIKKALKKFLNEARNMYGLTRAYAFDGVRL